MDILPFSQFNNGIAKRKAEAEAAARKEREEFIAQRVERLLEVLRRRVGKLIAHRYENGSTEQIDISFQAASSNLDDEVGSIIRANLALNISAELSQLGYNHKATVEDGSVRIVINLEAPEPEEDDEDDVFSMGDRVKARTRTAETRCLTSYDAMFKAMGLL